MSAMADNVCALTLAMMVEARFRQSPLVGQASISFASSCLISFASSSDTMTISCSRNELPRLR